MQKKGDCIIIILYSLFFKYIFIGAITALQFDEIHLVSGSADKTIRVSDKKKLMVMSMNFGFDCFVYCLGLGFADWICL
jgi:WD40 repeat protein